MHVHNFIPVRLIRRSAYGTNVRSSPTIEVGFLIVVLIFSIMSLVYLAPKVSADPSANSTVNYATPTTDGYPGGAAVNNIGNSLVSLVESSPQFQAVAGDTAYHVNPGSSFGYTWGPGIAPTSRIVFYSQNLTSQIEVDVYANNDTIQHIYLTTNISSTPAFNGAATADWGGYQAEYCHAYSALLGCYGGSAGGGHYDYLSNVSGYIDMVNDHTTPLSGPGGSNDENNACCGFAEWTGVGNSTLGGTYLTQGGASWTGFKTAKLTDANSNNYTFFTEEITSSSCGIACAPTYLSPPSSWSVSGQVIHMSTAITTNCGAGDQWSETWSVGSTHTIQDIACLTLSTMYYGYYIFEAPYACAGGAGGQCQLPDFSYSSNPVGFTGVICNLTACQNLDANHNTLNAWYIAENGSTANTAESTIPQNGDSWTTTWESSST